MSRDDQIAAVTAQINDLLDDLTNTVAALNTVLTGDPALTTGTEEPRNEQPRS